jgi:hypothetical protein
MPRNKNKLKHKREPQHLAGSIPGVAQHPADSIPLTDFNLRSGERTELLSRLKSQLEDIEVTPSFWACCQLGDTKTLEVLVRFAKDNPSVVSNLDYMSHIIPLMCKSPDF